MGRRVNALSKTADDDEASARKVTREAVGIVTPTAGRVATADDGYRRQLQNVRVAEYEQRVRFGAQLSEQRWIAFVARVEPELLVACEGLADRQVTRPDLACRRLAGTKKPALPRESAGLS